MRGNWAGKVEAHAAAMTSATPAAVFWSVSMPTPGVATRRPRPTPPGQPGPATEAGAEPVPAAASLEGRLTVSVTEAAGLLGISRALAYELVARGEVPSVRLGRRVVVPVVALRALVGAGGPL